MALIDLTETKAIALLARIARGLETTEDAKDFCVWLADTLNAEAGLNVRLAGGLDYESGYVSIEEFEDHMFQASLPGSDPRKRD
jgi:hypothetical protein